MLASYKCKESFIFVFLRPIISYTMSETVCRPLALHPIPSQCGGGGLSSIDQLFTMMCKRLCIVVGQQEGKRQLEKPRCGWVDNIRMDLVEMGWGGVDRVGLSRDRDRWRALVNPVINL
jgi:hypothetical protein